MPKHQEPRTKSHWFSPLASRCSPLSAQPRWRRLLLQAGAVAALTLLGALLGGGLGAARSADVARLAAVPSPPVALRATPAPPRPAPVRLVATPAGQPIAGPAAPGQRAERWPVLLSEPFEQASAAWPALRGAGWAARYRDGGYALALDGRPGISYSAPLPARDFWLAADVRIASGQAGLFCLLRRPNDFYRFLIDSAGRYRLEVQQVGFAVPLIDWTASAALRTGAGALNRLAAQRAGTTLTLYANGVRLASYELPNADRLEGRAGLALDAPAGTQMGAAWFDTLEVRAPAP